jgi:hypothetical protein
MKKALETSIATAPALAETLNPEPITVQISPITTPTPAEILRSFATHFLNFDEQDFPAANPETGGLDVDLLFQECAGVILNDYVEATFEEVEERIEANQYATEAERIEDNDLRVALMIIDRDINPEVKAAAKREIAEARTHGELQFQEEAKALTHRELNAITDDLRKQGILSAEWPLDTEQSKSLFDFARAAGTAIALAIESDPDFPAKVMELEYQFLADPSPAAIEARVTAYSDFLHTCDNTGETLIRRIVAKLLLDGWPA